MRKGCKTKAWAIFLITAMILSIFAGISGLAWDPANASPDGLNLETVSSDMMKMAFDGKQPVNDNLLNKNRNTGPAPLSPPPGPETEGTWLYDFDSDTVGQWPSDPPWVLGQQPGQVSTFPTDDFEDDTVGSTPDMPPWISTDGSSPTVYWGRDFEDLLPDGSPINSTYMEGTYGGGVSGSFTAEPPPAGTPPGTIYSGFSTGAVCGELKDDMAGSHQYVGPVGIGEDLTTNAYCGGWIYVAIDFQIDLIIGDTAGGGDAAVTLMDGAGGLIYYNGVFNSIPGPSYLPNEWHEWFIKYDDIAQTWSLLWDGVEYIPGTPYYQPTCTNVNYMLWYAFGFGDYYIDNFYHFEPSSGLPHIVQVTNAQAQSGTQSVWIDQDNLPAPYIASMSTNFGIPMAGTGTWDYWFRTDTSITDTNGAVAEMLDQTGNGVIQIQANAGNFEYNDGGAWTVAQAFAADTWYQFTINFDTVAKTYTLDIDSNPVGAAAFARESGTLTAARYRGTDGTQSEHYIDDVSVTCSGQDANITVSDMVSNSAPNSLRVQEYNAIDFCTAAADGLGVGIGTVGTFSFWFYNTENVGGQTLEMGDVSGGNLLNIIGLGINLESLEMNPGVVQFVNNDGAGLWVVDGPTYNTNEWHQITIGYNCDNYSVSGSTGSYFYSWDGGPLNGPYGMIDPATYFDILTIYGGSPDTWGDFFYDDFSLGVNAMPGAPTNCWAELPAATGVEVFANYSTDQDNPVTAFVVGTEVDTHSVDGATEDLREVTFGDVPTWQNCTVDQDNPDHGIVVNDYTNINEIDPPDGLTEDITEIIQGENSLSHVWRTTPVNLNTLKLEVLVTARTNTGADDSFTFGYGTTVDGPFTPMVTVNSDVMTTYNALIPVIIGQFYINVIDDNNQDIALLDTIIIDTITIESSISSATVTNQVATADNPGHGVVTGNFVMTTSIPPDGAAQQIDEIALSKKKATTPPSPLGPNPVKPRSYDSIHPIDMDPASPDSLTSSIVPNAGSFVNNALSFSTWVSSPAPLSPGPGPGPSAQVYYATRAAFDIDAGPLSIEDFEASTIGFGAVDGMDAPLDEFTNNVYFNPGDILPGIRIQDNPGPDAGGLVTIGVGFAGNPTKTVATNIFADSCDIWFDDPAYPVYAIGMELQSYWNPDTPTIEIYGLGGVLLDTVVAASDNAGIFWGVISEEQIEHINIFSATETDGGDNIAFGEGARANSLQHNWTMEPQPADSTTRTLYVNARTDVATNESFIFGYSNASVGGPWTDLFTLDGDSDTFATYSAAIPTNFSGPLWICVYDADKKDEGAINLSAVFVDMIRVFNDNTIQPLWDLEHRWRTQPIEVGAQTLELIVTARTNTGANDDFVFGYSTVLAGPYTPVLTVNSDIMNTYVGLLPNTLTDQIYFNVMDDIDDWYQPGHSTPVDTIFIDEIRVAYFSPGGSFVQEHTIADRPGHGNVTGTHVMTQLLDGIEQEFEEVNLKIYPPDPPSTASEPSPFGPGPGPQPTAQAYYTNRAAFDADTGPLPFFEDFEGPFPGPPIGGFDAPLDEYTNNSYFKPGDIEPGIRFWDNPVTPGGLVVIGAGSFGNPSRTVTTNTFLDSMDIDFFNNDTWAVGMDIQTYIGEVTVEINIYGVGGVLLDTTTTPGTNAGIFWGVISDELITSINLEDSTGNCVEGGDNIAFGEPARGRSLAHAWEMDLQPNMLTRKLCMNAHTNVGSENFSIGYVTDLADLQDDGEPNWLFDVTSDIPTDYSAYVPVNFTGECYIVAWDGDVDDKFGPVDTLYVDELYMQSFESAGTRSVDLHWDLSADDGAGENDVIGYNVYRADEEDGDDIIGPYDLIGTTPSFTDFYADPGEGLDLVNQAWYYVEAEDVSGQVAASGYFSKLNFPPVTDNVQADGVSSKLIISHGTSSVNLTANAFDDSCNFESIPNMNYSEYYDEFFGPDPGEGNGIEILPLDSVWDATLENLMTIINTSNWIEGEVHNIWVRTAEVNGPGNWTFGPATNITIEVASNPLEHSHEFPAIDGYTTDTTPTISVHVTDLSGINENTIKFYINGYRVFHNLMVIPDGFNVSYWHEGGFSPGEVVTCRIVVEDIYGNSLDFTWQFTVLNSFEIQLNEGWNLISLPLIQLDESLNKVLENINGKWDHIQTYDSTTDSWLSNIINRPTSLNNLDEMNHLNAYWINITEPNVNLSVGGYIPASTNIPLYAGWNLVGYPSLNTETVGFAFWGTGADKVEVFDPAEPYRIREVGPTYVMKPGEGYWIHVPMDTTWIIDW